MLSGKGARVAVATTKMIRKQQTRSFLGLVNAIDKKVYKMAKGVMPAISKTEATALACGTIGFDRDIFGGDPKLQHLVDKYKPKLTEDEKSFLDNEVTTLCNMIDDHKVRVTKDFEKEVWDYMRDKGFFALKIPKEWGGKGFSTQATSLVLCKLGTQSVDAFSTVAVPNSLGPGELLARYGTPSQKEYFLPRLADGTLIPCFGLTGPHAGSDATSLIGSSCVVEERNGELGVVATFKKRYITLAPVAGVCGLGLDLKDPNGLLKGKGEEGFTVALLERSHPGLRMGNRHMPLNAAFMNGTVEGEDVWIPMSNILGGQERCGYGWKMFVECLAEGRGVSLPAGAVGAGRGVVSAVGAYTRLRKQFRVPIAEFGGIQEALADSASDTLMLIGGSDLMNAIVDNHEAPMVISSIMKQNCTERGRRVVERGMDIVGGAGICMGPKNYLGHPYICQPISITVEGANIMTRSFQIIGQGLTRCHPHMLPLIQSLMNTDKSKEDQAVKDFVSGFYKVVGHGVSNFARSLTRGIKSTVTTNLRSSTAYKNGDTLVSYHEQQLSRLAANFAFTADLCFTLGGTLKFEELLMGRLADTMGAIFLGYATLHHYQRRRQDGIEGLEAVTEHALLRLEKEAQDALYEASCNFPGAAGKAVGVVMKLGCFPLGNLTRPYTEPSDMLTKEISKMVTTPTSLRTFYQEHCYHDLTGGSHQPTELVKSMQVCVEADAAASAIRREKRKPTQAEEDLIARADAIRDSLVQVDSFELLPGEVVPEQNKRPAIVGTAERLDKTPVKTYSDALNGSNKKAATA